jgi:N-acetylglucosamine malate deacetylase 2
MVMHSNLKFLEQLGCPGEPQRRVVVFAPHPDDEIIGACSILARCPAGSFLVFVTDGAPFRLGKDRASLQHERRKESDQIAAVIGIPPDQVFRLAIADQETTFRLPQLIHDVFALLLELDADVIVIPAYEGGHPDHDSTALAVHRASRLGAKSALLAEMCLYHDRDGQMETGKFLDHSSMPASLTLRLSMQDQILKQKAFDIYRSQKKVLRYFPTEFERFRVAPKYDFRFPPHSGMLFYERFDWGVTGAEWRQLAKRALREADRFIK